MKLFYYGACAAAVCLAAQAKAESVGNSAASAGKGTRCDSSAPTASLVSMLAPQGGKRDDLIASGRGSGKDGVSDSKGTSAGGTREASAPPRPAPTRTADSGFIVITPRAAHPEESFTLFPHTASNIVPATATMPPHIIGAAQLSSSAPASYLPSAYENRSSVSSATRLMPGPNGRLARVTAYWPREGDYYTRHSIAATGVRLHDGHCAVDPAIIPYGSVVDIAGVGKFLAVDTGSAVVERTAAREGGRNHAERSAIVVDLFFADAVEGAQFAAQDAKFLNISWWTPRANDSQARAARRVFADEDWAKIQSKQL
jgi:3D (Asp-Asp-Asp) domain-containing protein